MDQYSIYQCTSKKYSFTEEEDQPRAYVGSVEANSLEMAYRKSQNLDWPWNLNAPCRSTSVGDVIHGPDGHYMVCGMGFKKLDQ